MDINIAKDSQMMGEKAGIFATSTLKSVLEKKEKANLILATGASQFSVLSELVKAEMDWSRVTMFHLDEYIDLPEDHPASFRKYLKERFLQPINNSCTYHLIDGNQDPLEECLRVSNLIQRHPIDLALIGIGENGHLAFNDPPADFHTDDPYIIVNLDEACRKQQLGEGWFDNLDAVPARAISMSIKQILKSKVLVVSVPDERKAKAVASAINGPLTNACPASILRSHSDCHLFLDQYSASLL